MDFILGLKLNKRYYNEIVGLLLRQYDPTLHFSAGLIGPGSDVLDKIFRT